MSLFHCREWWLHKPEITSECSHQSLVVANIDNDPNGQDKIVTASFTGHLRIFNPTTSSGYAIDHLSLEQAFDEPIISIAAGRFITNSSLIALAILHPKKLVVYYVNAANGSAYFELSHCYTHRFTHHAYCMTIGPFGQARNGTSITRDCIAVLSLDCELLLFQAETFAFKRFIPSLLPGAMVYCAKNDSIIISTATHEIECYRYSTLGESVSMKSQHENAENEPDNADPTSLAVTSEKKLQSDWTLNLGEPILDMIVGQFTSNQPAGSLDIAILTRYTLYIVKDNGSIRWSKRLDYSPLCLTSYPSPTSDNLDHLIIGNEEQSLYVYRESTLIWAARTLMAPIAVRIGAFAGQKGLIVTINDTNEILIQFLGTSMPRSQTAIVNNEARELDYDSMDTQHRKLMKVIKQAASDKMQEPKERLIVKAQCPPMPQWADCPYEGDEELQCDDRNRLICLMLQVSLTHTSPTPLTRLKVILSLPSFLFTPEHTQYVEQLVSQVGVASATQPHVLTFPIYVKAKHQATSLMTDIGCTFTTSDGNTRTCRSEIKLPLMLVGRLKLPVKNTTYCLTFDSNKQPPSLTDLFSDLFDGSPSLAANGQGRSSYENSAHVLSFFHWHNDTDVTLLVSKKTGRYRVQASTLSSFGLLAADLLQRLNIHFNGQSSGGDEFLLSFQDDLPLNDYFTAIETHFHARQNVLQIRESLEKLSRQFRAIEKRLLVRFKDKNPVPLASFDTLMKSTHAKIQTSAEELDASLELLRQAGCELHCCSSFIVVLASCKYSLDKRNTEMLRQCLGIGSCEDRVRGVSLDLVAGWEERVDAALVHVLKYVLTKNAGNNASSQTNTSHTFDIMKDVTRLHKHLSMMFERLNKGLRFVNTTKEAHSKPASGGPGTPPASAGGERRRRGPSLDLREHPIVSQAIQEAEAEEEEQ